MNIDRVGCWQTLMQCFLNVQKCVAIFSA